LPANGADRRAVVLAKIGDRLEIRPRPQQSASSRNPDSIHQDSNPTNVSHSQRSIATYTAERLRSAASARTHRSSREWLPCGREHKTSPCQSICVRCLLGNCFKTNPSTRISSDS
jgi:uncharacterized protein involved in type VI secretion and phage assembly